MEDFRLTAMREAARTTERWIREWGLEDARTMTVEHLSGVNYEFYEHDMCSLAFRAAYLTAFGR